MTMTWGIDPETGCGVELLTEQQYEDMLVVHSEQAAELRAEQFFENRGYDEALAQEQWERERGVISFEDAFADSMKLFNELNIKKDSI